MEHTGSYAQENALDDDVALSLAISANPNQPSLVPATPNIPSFMWDGRTESLRLFFSELELQLSLLNPTLTQLAVEGFVTDKNKIIIFHLAQAAQIDGHQDRPIYTWNKPAPTDMKEYAVTPLALSRRFWELQQQQDPRPDLPLADIHPDTPYPYDHTKYNLSPPQLQNFDMLLRNNILRFVSDLATRHELAQRHPRSGRNLLDELRAKADEPLSITQVDSILASIEQLIDTGLKTPTVQSFQNMHLQYIRLLTRIPDSNPSKDTAAQQANKLIKATMGHDPQTGRALLQHISSQRVDRSNPAEVAQSIRDFLEDNLAIQRMCTTARPTPDSNLTVPNNSDPMAIDPPTKSLIAHSLAVNAKDPKKHFTRKPTKYVPQRPFNPKYDRPCRDCNGMHWDCGSKDGQPKRYQAATDTADTRAARSLLVQSALSAWNSNTGTDVEPAITLGNVAIDSNPSLMEDATLSDGYQAPTANNSNSCNDTKLTLFNRASHTSWHSVCPCSAPPSLLPLTTSVEDLYCSEHSLPPSDEEPPDSEPVPPPTPARPIALAQRSPYAETPPLNLELTSESTDDATKSTLRIKPIDLPVPPTQRDTIELDDIPLPPPLSDTLPFDDMLTDMLDRLPSGTGS